MRTRLSLLFSVAAVLHSAAWAQNATSANDPRDLLLRVRQNVTGTLARLPRYLCTLTIDRVQYAPPIVHAGSCDALVAQQRNGRTGRIAATDRLRLDVAIAASNEIYSWVGEDRFNNPDVFDLVKDGALQTGVHSTFLAAIFRDDVASFSYNGETKVDGRELAEFSFEVPQERSHYLFGNRVEDSVVGYGGNFLADPNTADLVRLTVRTAALPEDSGACQATTTLDYTHMRLNDSDFLLPRQAQLDILNLDGVELHNSTVYSSCHEFVGESTLKFGDADASSAAAGASAASSSAPAWPPAGAVFKLRFDQAIDTKTAAAGDRILARLNSPIKDISTRAVLIPEGAVVTARIVKLQHFFSGPTPAVRMLVKLETVTVGGSARPLVADFAPDARTLASRSPLWFGGWDAVADPHVATLQFQNAGAGFVIKSGLESTWTTLTDPGSAIHP